MSELTKQALWANHIQRQCLLEAEGDIDTALAAAEYIVATQPVPEDFALSTDEQGHEHKGKGEGGGQFTGKGKGGNGANSGAKPNSKNKTKPKKDTPSLEIPPEHLPPEKYAHVWEDLSDKFIKEITHLDDPELIDLTTLLPYGARPNETYQNFDKFFEKGGKLVKIKLQSDDGTQFNQNIMPAQDHVFISTIKKLMANPRARTEPPKVISFRGKNYIEDGTHRVFAAMMAGEDTMTVLRIKLPDNGVIPPKYRSTGPAKEADYLLSITLSHDIHNERAQKILNKSLVAVKGLTAAAKKDLAAALKRNTANAGESILKFVNKYRLQLAKLLTNTQMASLLEGAREVAKTIPPVATFPGAAPPPPSLDPREANQLIARLEALPEVERAQAIYDLPPEHQTYAQHALAAKQASPPIRPPDFTPATAPAEGPDNIHYPVIKEAVEQLSEKNVLTRERFDALDAATRAKSFTVAGVDAENTLTKIRDSLAENIDKGVDYETWKQKILDSVDEGTFLSEAHMENVFRTNVQTAFSDGQETVLSHPLVRNAFPYRARDAIHDDRVRENHLALEKLGIQGTNIYRADDPVWQLFRAPWDYNDRCADTAMTVRQAAEAGIKEAQEWLKTGMEPSTPTFVKMPAFQPPEGFRRSLAAVPLSIQLSLESIAAYAPASIDMPYLAATGITISEDDYPRDKARHFINKHDIAEATFDPSEADRLRARMADDERWKLDRAIEHLNQGGAIHQPKEPPGLAIDKHGMVVNPRWARYEFENSIRQRWEADNSERKKLRKSINAIVARLRDSKVINRAGRELVGIHNKRAEATIAEMRKEVTGVLDNYEDHLDNLTSELEIAGAPNRVARAIGRARHLASRAIQRRLNAYLDRAKGNDEELTSKRLDSLKRQLERLHDELVRLYEAAAEQLYRKLDAEEEAHSEPPVAEEPEELALSVDAEGHEHRGKGKAGGQFTGKGKGGNSGGKSNKFKLKSAVSEFRKFAREGPGEDIIDFEDAELHLGTKNAGYAALQAYFTGAYSEINSQPDHPISKAMVDLVNKLPDSDVYGLVRVMAFPSDKERAAFLKKLGEPGTIYEQDRTFWSWNDYEQGTAQGDDIADQYGKFKVELVLDDPISAKDISVFGGAIDDDINEDAGGEILTSKGSKYRVISVDKDGDTYIVNLESTTDNLSAALGGQPARAGRGQWITIGGHPNEKGEQHEGGFRVMIDGSGRILKGRMRGKNVKDVKRSFDRMKGRPGGSQRTRPAGTGAQRGGSQSTGGQSQGNSRRVAPAPARPGNATARRQRPSAAIATRHETPGDVPGRASVARRGRKVAPDYPLEQEPPIEEDDDGEPITAELVDDNEPITAELVEDDEPILAELVADGDEPILAELDNRLEKVNKRIDRFIKLFASKGAQPGVSGATHADVGEWLGLLKESINKYGPEMALASLGEVKPAGPDKVQYEGGYDELSEVKGEADFIKAYLNRAGINLVTSDSTLDPNVPLVSSWSEKNLQAEGRTGHEQVAERYVPTDQTLKNKLEESKLLPGLESSEDINTVVGNKVTQLSPEVLAKFDAKYGKGKWIVKSYGAEAYAGFGIFFPQRVAQIASDAKASIKGASMALKKLGFKIMRDEEGGISGISDGKSVYRFNSPEFHALNDKVKKYGKQLAQAAPNEQGPRLPMSPEDSLRNDYGITFRRDAQGVPIGVTYYDGKDYNFNTPAIKAIEELDAGATGYAIHRAQEADEWRRQGFDTEAKFMVQPAFEAVGVSEYDRAMGNTWETAKEGRVHVVTRGGKASAVPYATLVGRGDYLPAVFPTNDSRAMEKAVEDAINQLPESERTGQLYAPDVMKTKDGTWKVLELNPSAEGGGSDWLGRNPFVIDALSSHITGRDPMHVSFIKKLLKDYKGAQPPVEGVTVTSPAKEKKPPAQPQAGSGPGRAATLSANEQGAGYTNAGTGKTELLKHEVHRPEHGAHGRTYKFESLKNPTRLHVKQWLKQPDTERLHGFIDHENNIHMWNIHESAMDHGSMHEHLFPDKAKNTYDKGLPEEHRFVAELRQGEPSIRTYAGKEIAHEGIFHWANRQNMAALSLSVDNDQPRKPAGQADGGQFAKKGESGRVHTVAHGAFKATYSVYNNKKVKGTRLALKNYKQKDIHSCGFVAALTVSKFLDEHASAKKVLAAVRPKMASGVNGEEMQAALKKLGVRGHFRNNLSLKEIERLIKRKIPVMLTVYPEDWTSDHWVVVQAIDRANKRIYLTNYKSLSFQQFNREWFDRGEGLVCTEIRQEDESIESEDEVNNNT